MCADGSAVKMLVMKGFSARAIVKNESSAPSERAVIEMRVVIAPEIGELRFRFRIPESGEERGENKSSI
jgi:hypothetical protein